MHEQTEAYRRASDSKTIENKLNIKTVPITQLQKPIKSVSLTNTILQRHLDGSKSREKLSINNNSNNLTNINSLHYNFLCSKNEKNNEKMNIGSLNEKNLNFLEKTVNQGLPIEKNVGAFNEKNNENKNTNPAPASIRKNVPSPKIGYGGTPLNRKVKIL